MQLLYLGGNRLHVTYAVNRTCIDPSIFFEVKIYFYLAVNNTVSSLDAYYVAD